VYSVSHRRGSSPKRITPTMPLIGTRGDFSLIVTQTPNGNRICSCGSGAWGQLGHGTNDWSPQLRVIQHLKSTVMISSVSVGGRHSLALSTVGQVYAFGSNQRGQLGLGDARGRKIPILMTPLSMCQALDMISLPSSFYYITTNNDFYAHIAHCRLLSVCCRSSRSPQGTHTLSSSPLMARCSPAGGVRLANSATAQPMISACRRL